MLLLKSNLYTSLTLLLISFTFLVNAAPFDYTTVEYPLPEPNYIVMVPWDIPVDDLVYGQPFLNVQTYTSINAFSAYLTDEQVEWLWNNGYATSIEPNGVFTIASTTSTDPAAVTDDQIPLEEEDPVFTIQSIEHFLFIGMSIPHSDRLKGFSNLVSLQGVNFTICHAAHIRCNFQLTRERALAAALGCAKRHAFLRASFSPIPKTSFTKPVFAPLEDFTPALEIINGDWERIIFEEIMSTNLETPLFRWKIVLPSPESDEWHVLLFSSHAVSDGFSGMIILNDFFTNLSNLTPLDEIPLGERTYQCLDLFGKKVDWKTNVKSWIFKQLFRLVILRNVKLLLPHPIEPEPSFFYSVGSKDTMKSLIAMCKAKGLTLHGPLTACLILAIYPYYRAKQKKINDQMQVDIGTAFNLRQRLPDSSAVGQVGTFVGMGDLCWKQDLNMSFWDLAKNAKLETDKTADLDEMFSMQCLYDKIRSVNTILSVRPDGALGTTFFSNVGKYPFPLEHAASSAEQLSIDAVHVVNPAIPMGSQFCFFSTGTNHLCYSLQSRINKEESQKIFDQWVGLCERCHEFGDEPALSYTFVANH